MGEETNQNCWTSGMTGKLQSEADVAVVPLLASPPGQLYPPPLSGGTVLNLFDIKYRWRSEAQRD